MKRLGQNRKLFRKNTRPEVNAVSGVEMDRFQGKPCTFETGPEPGFGKGRAMIGRDGLLTHQRYVAVKPKLAKQGGGCSPGMARAKDHHLQVRSAHRSPPNRAPCVGHPDTSRSFEPTPDRCPDVG